LKSKIIFTLKAVVSFTLISIIISKIDWDSAVKHLSNANVFLILLTILIALFIRYLMALKWNILLKVSKSQISSWNLLKVIMIGGFLGMFLPSSLSTDVIRGYYLSKENKDKLHITSTIVIDRLLGVLSLLVTGIIGIYVSNHLLDKLNLEPVLFIGIAMVVFIFIVMFNKTLLEKFNRLFQNKNSKIQSIIKKGYNALSDFYNHPKALSGSFLLSLSVQLLRIVRFYLIAVAINVDVPFLYFVVVVPTIMIVLMIPVSLGGIGVKEGAAISLLVLLGITHNDAIVLTLIESLTTTFVTLLGGLFYLSYKKEIVKA
jgi:uncharacterized protein (TIRG00374 family)